jgi:NAD(P)-dependent dehydrogenase (short-subunit alcohol dehydrogenase family)
MRIDRISADNSKKELAMTTQEPNPLPTAVVCGVGAERGLGAALSRRFAAEGCHVLVAGRTTDKVARVAGAIAADLVVYNAGNNRQMDFRDVSAEQFESFWRVGCFGGFLVGREAARRLVPLGRGTVLFTGASASLRGRPGFAQFAAAKAGLRAIVQSMAREFGPHGIHVAHVVIDGGINGERLLSRNPKLAAERGEDGLLGIDAIADAYWHIHKQHRSAWTHELDLRPYKERF